MESILWIVTGSNFFFLGFGTLVGMWVMTVAAENPRLKRNVPFSLKVLTLVMWGPLLIVAVPLTLWWVHSYKKRDRMGDETSEEKATRKALPAEVP